MRLKMHVGRVLAYVCMYIQNVWDEIRIEQNGPSDTYIQITTVLTIQYTARPQSSSVAPIHPYTQAPSSSNLLHT